jgi:hypothetical protein
LSANTPASFALLVAAGMLLVSRIVLPPHERTGYAIGRLGASRSMSRWSRSTAASR